MPEIKNQFTGGKMNKDLDERLVPNGEYRDAMNIQVATSEGSDVGTAQNILGNILQNVNFKNPQNNFSIPDSSVVIGAISDEKLDTMYYLVWSFNSDFIMELKNVNNSRTWRLVFVDNNKTVLKFTADMIITGINVIDGMLFWTDNINEPRKINIQRCIDGTVNGGTTQLVNDSTGGNTFQPVEEKHITVIRKGPQASPDMRLFTSRDPEKIYTAVIKTSYDEPIYPPYDGSGLNDDGTNSFTQSSAADGRHDFNNIDDGEGNEFFVRIYTGLNSIGEEIDLNNATPNFGPLRAMTGWCPIGSSLSSMVGTKVLLQAYDVDDAGIQTPPGLPLTDYTMKGYITNVGPSVGNTAPNPPWEEYHTIGIRITNLEGTPPIPKIGETLKYVIDLYDETEKLFEFKYPRFSYRYKFEDGEYSTFAPFTQVAFVPGAFDYHPRKGYNIGMTNKLVKVELLNLVTENTPTDVVAIDVLFKDDASPSIYIVDTIRPDDYSDPGDDNLWNGILASSSDPSIPLVTFNIEKEAISSIVPSNQLLRPWDNVPKKALAQDVTGNRIVYANYHQNYDLINEDGEKYVPSFSITNKSFFQYTPLNQTSISSLDLLINPGSNVAANTFRSIKSLREYQLGVVFMDEYGRETPVISNASGTIKINKTDAKNSNRLNVQFNSDNYPQALTNFKFFIKETSSEYYNMAMDRWYAAGDGNIWLAFPSSDRNKIDIDTFLILKKGSDQDTLVEEAARYKVLAIESEAPDFIKTTKRKAVSITHGSASDIFGSSGSDGPFEGLTSFKMNYAPFYRTSGQDLANAEEELWIEFSKVGEDLVSERYKINSITNSYVDVSVAPDATAAYSIELEEPLGTDVNFITNDPGGTNSNIIENGAVVHVYKYKVENLERFDGRFFVKVLMDEVFLNNIETTTIGGGLRVSTSKKVYSMETDMVKTHTWDLDRFLTNHRGFSRHNNSNAVESWRPQWDRAGAANPGADYVLYGYYAVDEFTAFATYFRKYQEREYNSSSSYSYGVAQTNFLTSNQNDTDDYLNGNCRALVHLSNGVFGGTNQADSSNQVEYKKSGYKHTTGWWEEFGYNTVNRQNAGRALGRMDKNMRGLTSMWSSNAESWNPTGAASIGGYFTSEHLRHASDYNSVRDHEVWFIDSGPITGRSRDTNPDNTLEIGNQGSSVNQYVPNGHEGTSGFSEYSNQWRMDLAFGGIKSPNTTWNQREDQEGFWNVGSWNNIAGSTQNPSYTGDITNFVSKLNTGSRFRWKEDPTQTIYTINGLPTVQDRLRHSDGPFMNTTDDTQTVLHGHNEVNGGDRQQYGRLTSATEVGRMIDLRSMAECLSFNMTKLWRLNNIQPSTAVNWNPIGLGVISNSAMDLVCCDEAGDITSGNGATVLGGTDKRDDLTIFVKDITITTSAGTKRTLHEGMALKEWTGSLSIVNLGQDPYVVREITHKDVGLNTERFELKLGGYRQPFKDAEHAALGGNRPEAGADLRFVQVGMNGYSPNSEFNINTIAKPKTNGNTHMKSDWGAIGSVGYTLEFVEEKQPVEILSENPAIWETEPKETTALDVYYEASGSIPAIIDDNTIQEAFPIGTKFMEGLNNIFTVIGYNSNRLIVSGGAFPSINSDVEFFRPDDLIIQADIIFSQDANGSNNNVPPFTVGVQQNLVESNFTLPWHNCYSFQNGVESNRIRDNFNLPYISNGVKASTTLEQEYKEEHRKYGLIYSGIYNSTSGINNLNQFIAAEKITKDVNPIYGSIQKLYSRDSDVVALCEDKILKIQANKDALFNADGNSNVTASSNVLGQTIPFSGEYGISTNPESFAEESYRAYFTDRVRGAVMRLSKDGLTPISDAGMKDWFRDNLGTANRLIGSYDDRNDEYNICLNHEDRTIVSANRFTPMGFASGEFEGPNFNSVLSFSEKVGGWISFRSFNDMQYGISLANDYYTFFQGNLYLHYANENRNLFYNIFTPSTLDVILNSDPGSVKVFNTLNYEGSQSKVNKFVTQAIAGTTYNDQEYHNLYDKHGWSVESIITNKEEGKVNEFLEKEGKWFNGINKVVDITANVDSGDFTFQGIGEVINAINSGCMNPVATNYNSLATIDDGSCVFTPGGGGTSNFIIPPCPTLKLTLYYNTPTTINGIGVPAGLRFSIPSPGTSGGFSPYTEFSFVITAANGYVHSVYPGVSGGPNDIDAIGVSGQQFIFVDKSEILAAGDTQWNISVTFDWIDPTFGLLYSCTTVGIPFSVILGCTRNNFANYNPAATVDDGSCSNTIPLGPSIPYGPSIP